MDKPERTVHPTLGVDAAPSYVPHYEQVPDPGKSMVGEVVMYNLRQNDEHDDDLRMNGATQLPAIVVSDHSHGQPPYRMNLRVMTDSDEIPGWRTSVPLYDGHGVFGGFWEFKK